MATNNQPAKTTKSRTGQPPMVGGYLSGMKLVGLIFGSISIVVSIIAIIFGFAVSFMAAIAAFTFYIGIRTKTPYLLVLGVIGVILALVALILSAI